MLAHSTELGVKGGARGSVVVLGMFSTRSEANAWRSHHGYGRVVELGHWPPEPEREYYYRITQLVRIDASEGAAVYEESDINFKTPRSRLTPLCTLPHDTVYLLGPTDYQMFAQWVPARCPNGKNSGKTGFVYKTDTLLDAAFVPQKDGSIKLMQTTFVECDMDTVDEWVWKAGTEGGSRVAVEGWAYDTEGNASGGCGAY